MKQALKKIAYKTIGAKLTIPSSWWKAAGKLRVQRRRVDLLRELKINCVIDVGANKGWFAWSLRQCGYQGDIISIEPIPRDYAHIMELSRGDQRWTALNIAAGEKPGPAVFNIVSWQEGKQEATVLSSFRRPTVCPVSEQIAVSVERLDEILKKHYAISRDLRIFLKTDTQGFDLEVVRGAQGIMAQVACLQSELSVIPIYEGMPTYLEALAYYESLGFGLHNLDVVSHHEDGRVLEYDCLMVRRPPLEERLAATA